MYNYYDFSTRLQRSSMIYCVFKKEKVDEITKKNIIVPAFSHAALNRVCVTQMYKENYCVIATITNSNCNH